MVELTERTRRLLNLLNQLSQNTTQSLLPQDGLTNSNVDVTFPSFDLGLDLGLDLGGISIGGGGDDGGNGNGTPSTIRELLLTLVGEAIEVTVPFGTVSGTLLSVQNDYIVLIDAAEQVLVPIGQIEIVNEL